MKKIIAFILIAASLSSLFGCSPDVEITDMPEEEKTTEEKKKSEETETDSEFRGVDTPLTLERLLSMKVATPDTPISELRDMAAEFMCFQNSFPWVAGDDYSGKIIRNRLYLGIPYQNHSGSIYCWADFTDPVTGVFKLDAGHKFGSYFGNDCADQLFWSWARVSSAISFGQTRYMTAHSSVMKVGKYTYPKSVDDFMEYNTDRICTENGEKVMLESYAALQRGDGLMNYVKSNDTFAGHAMIVLDVHIERSGSGIDPKKSYVLTMEQTGEVAASSYGGFRAYDLGTAGENDSHTFDELYKKGYLPISCAELLGTKKVQTGKAVTDTLKNGKTYTADEMKKADIKTNFRISNAYFTVMNENGDVLMKKAYYGTNGSGTEMYMYEMPVGNVIGETLGDKVTGTNRALIEVVISNGEKLTAFDGFLKAE